MLHVKADTMKALLITASKNDTRYYLKGIFVTRNNRGNALLTSTDGHRMLCVEHTLGDGQVLPEVDIIIPRDALKNALKIKTADGLVTIDSSGNGAALIAGVVRVPFVPFGATYPDFRQVVPKMPIVPTQPTTFNATYLADFSEVALLLGSSGKKHIQLITVCSSDAVTAALVTFGNSQAFGVLMPIRPSAIDGSIDTIDLAVLDLERTDP